MTWPLRGRKAAPPPCREACPAGVDVSRYVRLIRCGEFDQARAVVREAIPFSAVCSHACTHPCEVRCARIQYDETLAIRLLKRAAEENGETRLDGFIKQPDTNRKVAIVGAGPCGLTAGYYLALLGHRITVFEALSQPGGMLWYGIPSYRLPREVIAAEIELIKRPGVDIVTNRPIRDLKGLFTEGFSAVLLAGGAWESERMGISGEDIPEVLNGLEFLRGINEGRRPWLGKKVAVVGGGNTAIDAARSSVRLGAEVRLLYRRRQEDMPASREEIIDAREEGIEMEFLTAPVKVEKGSVTCVKMTSGPLDDSGRPTPRPIEGSEFTLPLDTLIMAVGQSVQGGFSGLMRNSRGTVRIDRETWSTSWPGVFAAGDMVTGPSTIIQAISQGKQASMAIDKYLGGRGSLDFLLTQVAADNLYPAAVRGSARPKTAKVPPSERLRSFDLTEPGLNRDKAIYEAGRCLACDLRAYEVKVNADLCKECGYCGEICRLNIFETASTFNTGGYKPSRAAREESCVGCLKCLYICPDFAISIKEVDGVTDQNA